MISIDVYFSDPTTGDDRRTKYPNEYNSVVKANAEELLRRVEGLFNDLGIVAVRVSSGWRPMAVNEAAGGSKGSCHLTGEAIDLVDTTGQLKQSILNKVELLEKHDLYMEDPSHTKSWAHLQTRKTKSGKHVFIP